MNTTDNNLSNQKKYIFNKDIPQYVLDLNKLKIGDIILTKDKTKQSKAVRIATSSNYSHAMICLSPSSAIDATRDRHVFTLNTQRLVFKSLKDCCVLRLKSPLTEDNIQKIEQFLRLTVATPYSIKEAIKTPWLSNKSVSTKEKTQFCSRLVAQAYNGINQKLVNNPDYCSPQDLLQSTLLYEITDVLRIATTTDLQIANKPDLVAENFRQTIAWLNKCAALAKTVNYDIRTINDVDNFLITHPKYDRRVCEYIESTRYLSQYLDDELANPQRYKLNPKQSLNIHSELQMNIKIFELHKKNYYNSCQNYKNSRLNFHKLHRKLYFNLLKQIKKRLDILISYEKQSDNYSNEIILKITELKNLVINVLK